MNEKRALSVFNNSVVNTFHIYNSLFLKLPFDDVYETGVLLPILANECEAGYALKKSPYDILTGFLNKQTQLGTEAEQISALFRFIQYIERQIVLFDSVEDAAYDKNHDQDGPGSIAYLANECNYLGQKEALLEQAKNYKVRVVLTAHPTQFYPGPVLGIMTDLTQAIADNDLEFIEKLLQQLGKTPLFSHTKPTPFDEAVSLIWYLENIFYTAIGNIFERLDRYVFDGQGLPNNSFIDLGFWPGGDRDGNPFVNAETTLKVAQRLKNSILKCYYRDVRALKRRLTFDGVDVKLLEIEQQLYRGAYLQDTTGFNVEHLLADLLSIQQLLEDRHKGLFVDNVQTLINKVRCFGFHFATLDIRQDSRKHHEVMCEIAENTSAIPVDYSEMSDQQRVGVLSECEASLKPQQMGSPLAEDTLASIAAIKAIQNHNGEAGANRYIISNCQSALNVMEVLAFFQLSGFSKGTINVDVIPLFETIDDLKNAPQVMQQLYQNPRYGSHLKHRNKRQTIMLGFSDGTKDGGYLAANWSILQAKEALTAVGREHGIETVFFDGRGGPPARGGGETHKFYASLSDAVENKEIQLTIQGQTISCNFGTTRSAQYNLEQLLSAGLSNTIRAKDVEGWDSKSRSLMQHMAEQSLAAYLEFKKDPQFIPYLEKISTLKYYGKTNIGSRPSKRSDSSELKFEDLRAIPFVGAWSQLKQNVLGYYGVGKALKEHIASGEQEALQKLYKNALFFKALMDNSMMSICKSFMPLTQYLQDDPEFAAFWLGIYTEFNDAQEMLKLISNQQELLADKPVRRASIDIREKIVLPLLTIQQYSLQRIEQLKSAEIIDDALIEVYEKLVTRSLYGNINASRNSV